MTPDTVQLMRSSSDQDVAREEQAAMGNAEDQKPDHSVAINAPGGQPTSRRRTHQEPKSDAENEGE